jgi:acyl dehydratase
MSNEPLYYDDVQVGDTWKSGARTVTETDVVMFAGLTGDFNPLHVDDEFARETFYGQRIAHGLYGTALVAGLGSHSPLMRTEAFVAIRDWNFLKPIFLGDTVHVHTEVLEKRESGRRRGTVVWKRQLINQKGETVQSGMFESVVSRRKST